MNAMSDDDVKYYATQGQMYLQAAARDGTPDLRLVHYNYAVAYFNVVRKGSTDERVRILTQINMPYAVSMAKTGQSKARLEYLKKHGSLPR